MAFFDKIKQAGSLLAESAGDLYDESKEAAGAAIEGIKAKRGGATIITKGVKEVHLTESQINNMKSYIDGDMVNEKFELILDDTATDDGYDTVRTTIVADIAVNAEAERLLK